MAFEKPIAATGWLPDQVAVDLRQLTVADQRVLIEDYPYGLSCPTTPLS